jgi:hypothetical protein
MSPVICPQCVCLLSLHNVKAARLEATPRCTMAFLKCHKALSTPDTEFYRSSASAQSRPNPGNYG